MDFKLTNLKLKALKPIYLFFFLYFIAQSSCTVRQAPTDDEGRPLIIKSGTIDSDLVETTPIVFKNKVYRFEYVRQGYWANQTGDSYFRFIDHETGEPTASFAKGNASSSRL